MMAMLAFLAFAQDGKAGAGDDQQVPDNQQTGGGKEMVTKTFELTLNGTVPEDRAFAVFYGTRDQFGLFESESEEPPRLHPVLRQPMTRSSPTRSSPTKTAWAMETRTALRWSCRRARNCSLALPQRWRRDLSTAEFFHGNVGTLFETGELTGEPGPGHRHDQHRLVHVRQGHWCRR